MDNVEIKSHGLKCDNEACDWKDETISTDDYSEWINRPCPKCGENLLTLEDYENAEMAIMAAKLLNTMTPEEIEAFSKNLNPDNIPGSEIFKGIPGAEHLDGEVGDITVSVDTHKELRIAGFKKEIKPE